ncbi:splicing endonuclease positive effector sen1, putative [Entamoeba invadens IP1]|uniref:splicing endonuclease positive effector sen1, putative n=1 Tax=Entamoeba invadens IP1 TaxID=370355 RepID=UPI0002C3DE2A|nr:splicing endonuclease positive effector sen1, putative [Entamoeba invadens IP1]ELP85043.1 splicing endonuclease positive effector sen1, putative [Entamoeba invadens IP1]|eukprot:XP_004184389.1 splicing endonuclease positive effector sen1, putative [Entamoeba invadens IP1]
MSQRSEDNNSESSDVFEDLCKDVQKMKDAKQETLETCQKSEAFVPDAPKSEQWVVAPTHRIQQLENEFANFVLKQVYPFTALPSFTVAPLNVYTNTDQYISTLKPFVFDECRSSIEKNINEKENENVYKVKVVSMKSSPQNVEVYVTIECRFQNDFSDFDFFVASTQFFKTKTYPKNNCKTALFVKKTEYGNGQFLMKFITDGSIESNDFFNSIQPKQPLFIRRIGTVLSPLREFIALNEITELKLQKQVLNPQSYKPTYFRPMSIKYERMLRNKKEFNDSQIHAMFRSLAKSGFSLIQGPPGTGKTMTLCGIIGVILYGNSSSVFSKSSESHHERVLICSPSNAAIDGIIMKLLKMGVYDENGEKKSVKIVRVGTPTLTNPEIKDLVLENLVGKEIERRGEMSLEYLDKKINELKEKLKNALATNAKINKDKLKSGLALLLKQKDDLQNKICAMKHSVTIDIISNCDVICCTLNSAGCDTLQQHLFGKIETCIIDEAVQCVEVSALIPLKYGVERCIMIGDQKQLPSTVLSPKSITYKYNKSLFERLLECGLNVTLLTQQYRMESKIREFPSNEFYEGRLADGVKIEKINSVSNSVLFLNVCGKEDRLGKESSLFNTEEVKAVVFLLTEISKNVECVHWDIGIITPYRKQVLDVKKAIEQNEVAKSLNVLVNTVDGFQGREFDIVIMSCVRSSEHNGIGFVEDERRLNVAITRAKRALCVVGNIKTLRQVKVWEDYINWLTKNRLILEFDDIIQQPDSFMMFKPNDYKNELKNDTGDKNKIEFVEDKRGEISTGTPAYQSLQQSDGIEKQNDSKPIHRETKPEKKTKTKKKTIKETVSGSEDSDSEIEVLQLKKPKQQKKNEESVKKKKSKKDIPVIDIEQRNVNGGKKVKEGNVIKMYTDDNKPSELELFEKKTTELKKTLKAKDEMIEKNIKPPKKHSPLINEVERKKKVFALLKTESKNAEKRRKKEEKEKKLNIENEKTKEPAPSDNNGTPQKMEVEEIGQQKSPMHLPQKLITEIEKAKGKMEEEPTNVEHPLLPTSERPLEKKMEEVPLPVIIVDDVKAIKDIQTRTEIKPVVVEHQKMIMPTVIKEEKTKASIPPTTDITKPIEINFNQSETTTTENTELEFPEPTKKKKLEITQFEENSSTESKPKPVVHMTKKEVEIKRQSDISCFFNKMNNVKKVEPTEKHIKTKQTSVLNWVKKTNSNSPSPVTSPMKPSQPIEQKELVETSQDVDKNSQEMIQHVSQQEPTIQETITTVENKAQQKQIMEEEKTTEKVNLKESPTNGLVSFEEFSIVTKKIQELQETQNKILAETSINEELKKKIEMLEKLLEPKIQSTAISEVSQPQSLQIDNKSEGKSVEETIGSATTSLVNETSLAQNPKQETKIEKVEKVEQSAESTCQPALMQSNNELCLDLNMEEEFLDEESNKPISSNTNEDQNESWECFDIEKVLSEMEESEKLGQQDSVNLLEHNESSVVETKKEKLETKALEEAQIIDILKKVDELKQITLDAQSKCGTDGLKTKVEEVKKCFEILNCAVTTFVGEYGTNKRQPPSEDDFKCLRKD